MAIEHEHVNPTQSPSSPQQATPLSSKKGNILAAHNATTGALIGELPITDTSAVREIVERARAAQPAWAALTFKQRGSYLHKFRDVMLERSDSIAQLISQEVGKPVVEGMTNEIMAAADIINYYVKNAEKMLTDKPITLHLLKHRKSYVHYAPLGVIGIIAPWNFPFVLAFSEVATALMAGNTVVLKPSEFTPQCGQIIADIFAQIGLPEDVFHVIHGEGPTGAALVTSGVDKICFTGGGSTARKILAAAAENLTPVVLELGGKNPMVVCADADLERAARAAVWGGFANSGQVCASVERIYVHKDIAEPFIQRTVELTRKLRVGMASEGEDVDIGSMIHERQVQIVEHQVQDALAKGAKVLVGGQRPQHVKGPFYEPTILVNVDHNMDVMREETFGPLLPIKVVASDQEAIRLANDSVFGLTAYVFSSNAAKADQIARQIEVGTVMINDVISSYAAPETPWGGVKQSGIGRIHGGEIGIKEFCQVRHVMGERIHLPNKRELWWFPYKQSQVPMFKRAFTLLFGGKK